MSRLIPRGVERYAIKNFFSWLWKWGMSLLKLHFLQASSKRFGKWCEMARVTIKPILPFIFMKFWFFMSSSVEREALKSLLKSHKGNRRELFPLYTLLQYRFDIDQECFSWTICQQWWVFHMHIYIGEFFNFRISLGGLLKPLPI